MKIIKAKDAEHLVSLSRHTGWCTKHSFHATNYLSYGSAWAFKKEGKVRPSYLMFVGLDGSWELKKKGNISVSPYEFMRLHPEHNDFISDKLLSKTIDSIFAQDDQYAECIIADVPGLDSNKRPYKAGDFLIRLCSGEVVCAEEPDQEKHNFRNDEEIKQIVQSCIDGIDDFKTDEEIKQIAQSCIDDFQVSVSDEDIKMQINNPPGTEAMKLHRYHDGSISRKIEFKCAVRNNIHLSIFKLWIPVIFGICCFIYALDSGLKIGIRDLTLTWVVLLCGGFVFVISLFFGLWWSGG